MVNDHYCCCCCNVCTDASNNFDANRLAYRFNNKDVTETNSNSNNNNNRSTQACTYRVTVVYTCDGFATSHTHTRIRIRFNDLQIQWLRAFGHIIYSTFTSSKRNTFNFIFQSAHRWRVIAQNIYYAILYGIVCVGFGIGCLNFQKFGLPAIVSLSFSVSFFFIVVVVFCSAAGASNRAKKRFSRENQVEAKKKWFFSQK